MQFYIISRHIICFVYVIYFDSFYYKWCCLQSYICIFIAHFYWIFEYLAKARADHEVTFWVSEVEGLTFQLKSFISMREVFVHPLYSTPWWCVPFISSMETILWEWKCNAICFFFHPQQPHLVVYHFRRQTLSVCLFWKSGVPNRNNLGALHQFTELSPSDPIKTRLRNRSYPALYPFYRLFFHSQALLVPRMP